MALYSILKFRRVDAGRAVQHRFALVVAAVLILIASLASAKSANIGRVEIQEVGIFSSELEKTVNTKDISTGQRMESKNFKLLRSETNVAIKPGMDMEIGLRLTVHGSPKGETVGVRVVWRYPEPGLFAPNDKVGKLSDAYNDSISLGTTRHFTWKFGGSASASERYIVPGTWVFELWTSDGTRMLARQEFTVRKG